MHGGNIYNHDIDLDFSVSLNPYSDPVINDAISDGIREGVASAGLYPDIEQRNVRHAIADAENTDYECVFAGAGASELLVASAHMRKPHTALLAEPCYSGYEYALRASGTACIKRYCTKESDGYMLTDDLLNALTADVDLVYLGDPCNPTGRNVDEELLWTIVAKARKNNTTIVIDRSFYMLSEKNIKNTDEKLDEFIHEYKNLFIIKSLTKCFALPGIRMGYVLSCPENILKLRNYLPEWNLSSVSSALMSSLPAKARDESFYEKSIAMIRSGRDFLCSGLQSAGFNVYGSDTNFILCRGYKDTYEKLLDNKILIRRCDDFVGLGECFYRIAVKTPKDNRRLIEQLHGIQPVTN